MAYELHDYKGALRHYRDAFVSGFNDKFFDKCAGEAVSLNITEDKPWVGFTQFQGDGQSVIHINRDVPVHAERAIELGCHEAYPGHHYFATLVEKEWVHERMSREEAIQWLMEHGLETRGTASQRLDFMQALRGLVVNYNYGKDLVRTYIESRANDDRNARWGLLETILSTPVSPSDLELEPSLGGWEKPA